ncbi:MAG: hypothetical protein HQ559_09150 [Lentisphaerae bacterium]|nr:hypothetical protein [Lentisphaerota bacterium]
MSEYAPLFVKLGIRLLFALPCFGMAVYAFRWAPTPLHALAYIVPFVVGGGLIVAPAIGEILAEPLRSLFYPGTRASRPGPVYSIPQSKRANGLYEEAMRGFEQIAANYPDDVKPYVEMIDMAVVNLRDGERAKMIFYRGLAELQKDEDKATLKQMYEATITRLQPEPEWLTEEQQRTLTAPDLKDQKPVKEPDGITARRFHAGPKGRYEGPSGKA